ncbi:MAG: minor capsid protein, partial [Anaerovoracaceae bacterium]
RYAKENKISLADARKRLTPNELIDFNKQSKIYLDEVERLGDKAFTAEYRSYLKELSGKAYVSRLEELTANIRHNLETLAIGYNTGLGQTLTEAYQDGFYRTMFDIQKQAKLGVSFTAPGGKQLETAIRERWLGQNYSDRIWADKNKLIIQLEQMLSQEFVRGRGPREVAKDFSDKMQTSYYNAQRLIRTELNYISNKGSMKAYKESEVVEKYQYLATLDNRTSDICRELDGKMFELKEAKVGVNLPPLHPHCRSTTIPYFEDNEIEDRVARDEDGKGKSYKLGKDVTFFEWVEQYGSPEYKKRVAEQRKRFLDMDKPSFTMESLINNLTEYVGGGYLSVKDAVTPEEFEYIQSKMKSSSNSFYRIEEMEFTVGNKDLRKGSTFTFTDNLRSFTSEFDDIEKFIRQAEDWGGYESPVVFQTVGDVKTFDMSPYTKEYTKMMDDQHEHLIGGKMKVVDFEYKFINNVEVLFVKIKRS